MRQHLHSLLLAGPLAALAFCSTAVSAAAPPSGFHSVTLENRSTSSVVEATVYGTSTGTLEATSTFRLGDTPPGATSSAARSPARSTSGVQVQLCGVRPNGGRFALAGVTLPGTKRDVRSLSLVLRDDAGRVSGKAWIFVYGQCWPEELPMNVASLADCPESKAQESLKIALGAPPPPTVPRVTAGDEYGPNAFVKVRLRNRGTRNATAVAWNPSAASPVETHSVVQAGAAAAVFVDSTTSGVRSGRQAQVRVCLTAPDTEDTKLGGTIDVGQGRLIFSVEVDVSANNDVGAEAVLWNLDPSSQPPFSQPIRMQITLAPTADACP